ncbi:hypothetical protein [Methanosarcina horonobensis]|nr:hypothetical protein [Methanosarcina horonobensis]
MILTENFLLLEPGLEAVRTRDETRLLAIIDELAEVGIKFFSGTILQETADGAIECIKSLGLAAAEGNMNSSVLNATASLG